MTVVEHERSATALNELIDALDAAEGPTRVSSVRQPDSLRRALSAAVELGYAATGNEGLNRALRAQLEAFAQRTALEAHYEAHPGSRPTLVEVALALAELDHSPLARSPALIALAAAEVTTERPGADADDVLLWASALLAHDVLPDDGGRE